MAPHRSAKLEICKSNSGRDGECIFETSRNFARCLPRNGDERKAEPRNSLLHRRRFAWNAVVTADGASTVKEEKCIKLRSLTSRSELYTVPMLFYCRAVTSGRQWDIIISMGSMKVIYVRIIIFDVKIF